MFVLQGISDVKIAHDSREHNTRNIKILLIDLIYKKAK